MAAPKLFRLTTTILRILVGVFSFAVITRCVLACLRADGSDRSCRVQDFSGACERAAKREQAMYSLFPVTAPPRSLQTETVKQPGKVLVMPIRRP
jgi:hypothetical protein